METVLLGFLALTLGAGVAGGLVTTWRLHRRTLQLEYRCNDLEERLLTFNNREKAQKRWTKEKATDDELEAFLGTTKAGSSSRTRFCNDPLEDRE